MIKTNTIDYIKQLEEENKLLKQRLLDEIEKSNLLITTEKLINNKLINENAILKQRNNYLKLLLK